MDEPRRTPRASFRPSPYLAWTAAALAVIAAVIAILDSDGGGRLLLGIAAIVLAAIAIGDLAYTPRLAVNAAGLAVRSPAARVTLTWAEIDDVRVDEKARLGLTSRALEIDAGAQLIVLSGRALGRDPRDVLPLVLAFRP